MYEMLSEEEAPLLTCYRGVAGSHIGHHHPRRESIFYRPSVSDSDSSPISLSRKISANSEILPEDLLVTPFAQILHSLRSVRNSYVTLTDTYIPSVEKTNQNGMKREISDSDAAKMAVDTLEDLDWCLVQLEKVQTHRSVSDMATTKFKRILSRELNQFSETGSSASEVSEYINSTFLDRYKDLEPETSQDHVIAAKQLRSSDEAREDVDDGSIPASSAASGSDDNNSPSGSSLGASSNNIVKSSSRNRTSSGQSFASCHRQLWAVSRHLKAPLIVPLESAAAESLHLSLSTTATMTPSSSPSSSLSTSPSSLCHNTPLPPPSSSSSSSPSSSLQMTVASAGAQQQHRQHHQQQQHIKSKLEMALDKASDWSFDIFHLTDLTSNRPLLVLTNFIFERQNLLKTLNVSQTVLLNFLNSVELNYSSRNSYHNNVHAADVVQSAYCLLSTPSIRDSLTDLDLIATLVAAAVHDVDHPGVTNQYLINSELDLAILYNDQSVLENHHLAVAFTILKDKEVNIFQNLPGGTYRTIRRMVIQMVLATDMSFHLRLVADLKTMIETQKVIITSRGRSASASTSSPQPVPCFLPSALHQQQHHQQSSMSPSSSGDHKRLLLLDNADDKMQVLQTLVHCADLGNPAKQLPLFQQWVERIMKEFFNQGDMEREQGLEVSPMCNRDISVEKAQVGFIDYIALPLWEAWDELVNHEFQGALDNLLYNRDWFESEMKNKNS